MSRPWTVSLRLDGVVAEVTNRGVEVIGRPVAGIVEFTRWLIEDLKACVIIETGRRRVDLVELWLRENGIKYSLINKSPLLETQRFGQSDQVIADVYIGQNYLTMPPGQLAPLVKPLLALRQQFNAESPSLPW